MSERMTRKLHLLKKQQEKWATLVATNPKSYT